MGLAVVDACSEEASDKFWSTMHIIIWPYSSRVNLLFSTEARTTYLLFTNSVIKKVWLFSFWADRQSATSNLTVTLSSQEWQTNRLYFETTNKHLIKDAPVLHAQGYRKVQLSK